MECGEREEGRGRLNSNGRFGGRKEEGERMNDRRERERERSNIFPPPPHRISHILHFFFSISLFVWGDSVW